MENEEIVVNEKKNKKNFGKALVLVALFAAFTSAGCFIQIPLPGGIPIVIQDMMAMLSGLLLGPLYGGLAVAVFLLLGVCGLPVYSGKAGIAVLIKGPTAGFLWGYLIGAVIGGLVLKIFLNKNKENSKAKRWIVASIAVVVATVVVFVCGIIGFEIILHKGIEKTLKAVLIPFIPGNLIKICVMIPLVYRYKSKIEDYLG